MRTTNLARSASAALLAATLLLAGPGEARAQGFGIEAGTGLWIPAGELTDVWKAGPAFGLGFVAPVSDVVYLRADGNLAFDAGDRFDNGVEAPDLTQFRYTGGVELRFTDDEVPNWFTVLGLGAGGVTYDTDSFRLPGGALSSFEETFFTLYGELRVGYRVNRHLAFSLQHRTWLDAMDGGTGFQVLSQGQVDGFEGEWNFPFQLRTEITF